MASAGARVPLSILQLKVTLRDADPPIWRRLLVPEDFTLAQLHDVLQIAMGWADCHLHEFEIARQRFGVPSPEDRLMGGPPCINERKVRLSEVLAHKGAKALYTYDFGDGWEHAIVVEDLLAAEPGIAYPLCIGGKRHAPPEDCGGIPGFYNFLEAIHDPEHEEHEALLEWIGGRFDPESFSPDAVSDALQQRFRTGRKAARKHSAGTN